MLSTVISQQMRCYYIQHNISLTLSCQAPGRTQRQLLLHKHKTLLWARESARRIFQRGRCLIQVRIHFDALYVRYLWPLVLPQYSPPESRPTLHNPLGLSQGLKSSSTSPQNGTKAAAIAMQFNPKMGIMRQSPSRRTRYVFYGIKMSDIESPQNSRKISQHAQFSHTKQ